MEIRLFEVPLSQQIKGLHDDLYDVGLSMANEVGDGIMAESVWDDPLMVAVPERHPLLIFKRVPLEEVLRYPLVLCDPGTCEGHARQVDRVLRRMEQEPLIAQYASTFDLMMAVVSAGLALGLAGAAHISSSREQGVVARPLAGPVPLLTTYMLRVDAEPSQVLARFIERVAAMDSFESDKPPASDQPSPREGTES